MSGVKLAIEPENGHNSLLLQWPTLWPLQIIVSRPTKWPQQFVTAMAHNMADIDYCLQDHKMATIVCCCNGPHYGCYRLLCLGPQNGRNSLLLPWPTLWPLQIIVSRTTKSPKQFVAAMAHIMATIDYCVQDHHYSPLFSYLNIMGFLKIWLQQEI